MPGKRGRNDVYRFLSSNWFSQEEFEELSNHRRRRTYKRGGKRVPTRKKGRKNFDLVATSRRFAKIKKEGEKKG